MDDLGATSSEQIPVPSYGPLSMLDFITCRSSDIQLVLGSLRFRWLRRSSRCTLTSRLECQAPSILCGSFNVMPIHNPHITPILAIVSIVFSIIPI